MINIRLNEDAAQHAIKRLLEFGEFETARHLARALAVAKPSDGKYAAAFHAISWGVPESDVPPAMEKIAAIRDAYSSGKFSDVREAAQALLEIHPQIGQARLYLALSYQRSGEPARAMQAAVLVDPLAVLDVKILSSLGELLFRGGETSKARIAFQAALELEETSFTLANWAALLLAMGAKQEAFGVLSHAVERFPDNELVLGNLAAASFDLGKFDAAERHARHLLTLNPKNSSGQINLANVMLIQKKWREAADLYAQIIERDPASWETRTKLIFCLARIADWSALDQHKAYVQEHRHSFEASPSAPNPWVLLSVFDDPALHQMAAKKSAARFNKIHAAPIARPKEKPRVLNLGFFSADYYNHPTTQLILGLFQNLNRELFSVHAFSFGPVVNDDYRKLVMRSVNHFHEVSGLSSEDIAKRARRSDIHIAIDLNGYTKNHRHEIFAYRAAPLQIQYLGYPGTTMSTHIDALIADEIVIPAASERYFSEEVIRLPGSYQINDRAFDAPDAPLARQQAELPPEGVILACFNAVQKINGAIFDLWMKVMAELPEAYLWLLCEEPTAQSNIRARARERGVNPDRILWAQRVPREEHLARHGVVDLFLDTVPYNAHTTASDALRMGVPIVTLPGHSFASRVCSSLLHALDLTELIAKTPDDYVKIAVDVIRGRGELCGVRERLQQRAADSAVFDPAEFTRGFESALLGIWERRG